MKTELAVRRELSRLDAEIARELRKGDATTGTELRFIGIRGAQQALAWALGENAEIPSRMFGITKHKVRKSK